MTSIGRRKYLVAAAIVTAVAAWVGGGYLSGRSQTRGWTRLASVEFVRDSGGVAYSSQHGLFVVLAGERVLALSAVSAGGSSVLYCPSSRLFEAITGGERFDGTGDPFSAARGLDRFPVKSYRGFVYARLTDRRPGGGPNAFQPRPKGAFCTEPDPARPGFYRPAS